MIDIREKQLFYSFLITVDALHVISAITRLYDGEV